MIKRKTITKQVSRAFRVVLHVANGPFETKTAAIAGKSGLKAKKISCGDIEKNSVGYWFTSSVGYLAKNESIKNRLIVRLKTLSKKAGVPTSNLKFNITVLKK